MRHGHARRADPALWQHQHVIAPLAPRLIGDLEPLAITDKPAPGAVVVAQRERVEFTARCWLSNIAVLGDQHARASPLIDLGDRIHSTVAIPEQEHIAGIRLAAPLFLDLETVAREARSEHIGPVIVARAE